MFGDFVSFLFLLAMIGTGILIWWAVTNDQVGLYQPLKGLLAIDEQANPPKAALNEIEEREMRRAAIRKKRKIAVSKV